AGRTFVADAGSAGRECKDRQMLRGGIRQVGAAVNGNDFIRGQFRAVLEGNLGDPDPRSRDAGCVILVNDSGRFGGGVALDLALAHYVTSPSRGAGKVQQTGGL